MFSISNPLFIYPTPWLHILPLPPHPDHGCSGSMPPSCLRTCLRLYITPSTFGIRLSSLTLGLCNHGLCNHLCSLFPREQSRSGNISNLFVSSFGLLLKFICLSSFHPFCMSNKSVKLGLRGNAVGSFYLRLP